MIGSTMIVCAWRKGRKDYDSSVKIVCVWGRIEEGVRKIGEGVQ